MDYPKLKSNTKFAITMFFVLVEGLIMLAVLVPKSFGQSTPSVEPAMPAPHMPLRIVGDWYHSPPLVHMILPPYPQLAKQARVQGVVFVKAVVDSKGQLESAKVVKTDNMLLDESALNAVKKWRWRPLNLIGGPSGFTTVVGVRFVLE